MEVLSIGEKIKRARIYSGYTLKEVCGDKISVSKLSCIENNKVIPEEWVLEYIASKLKLDIEYLNENIEKQIKKNMKSILENSDSKEYAKQLRYNLLIADKYGYYSLAVSMMHLIFQHFLKQNNIQEVQNLIGTYYDICNKCNTKYSKYVYYMDLGNYLYKNREFHQSASYFKNIRMYSLYEDDDQLASYSIYGEAKCYIQMKKYEDAYKVVGKLVNLIDSVSNLVDRAKMYKLLAILSLKMNDGKFSEYEKQSYKFYGEEKNHCAKAILDFACTMFSVGHNEEAIEYIKKAIAMYPDDNKDNLVKFTLLCAEELIKNEILHDAMDLVDNALNCAIKLNNIKFIEKSYYLKAILLRREGNLASAEMYMNLALDSLTKFGNKKELCDMYMIMGELYHEIGSLKESLRYFTLAISIQKKL
ncbi:ferrous iron transport protein B [Clostridium novyi A str. 4570]|uniref:Ferrous iron transport protein B n=1 Tax=Clostridium novyi A str. 4570 TaxID=1444290 RepID=A0AA88ZNK7_CLONO|nr:helix-turn-helix transcriptional regulator [Clostridium novyi]KGN01786.1 ferrous iron transport protein B [Clostridium novyi A str. 4570]